MELKKINEKFPNNNNNKISTIIDKVNYCKERDIYALLCYNLVATMIHIS